MFVFAVLHLGKLVGKQTVVDTRCSHPEASTPGFAFCPKCATPVDARTKERVIDVPVFAATCAFPRDGSISFVEWCRNVRGAAGSIGGQSVLMVERSETGVAISIGREFDAPLNGAQMIDAIDAIRTDLSELSLKRTDITIRTKR